MTTEKKAKSIACAKLRTELDAVIDKSKAPDEVKAMASLLFASGVAALNGFEVKIEHSETQKGLHRLKINAKQKAQETASAKG